MAGSTELREAKAKAKADARAEKARKKASTDPADMSRFRQIREAYRLTHEYDKPLPWLLLGAFLLPVVVLCLIGVLLHHPVMLTILGVMVGLLLAMTLLVQRTKNATYRRYEGQAGSAAVALQQLPKTWVQTPAIAANKHQDVLHRAVGPGGIVLIGEGEAGRVRQMLSSEQKKHEKVAYGITVSTLVMGDKPGQVPLNKITDHLRKMPKVLRADQVTDVNARLRALDAVRPKVPMPRGPVPTSMRGARSAMRGR